VISRVSSYDWLGSLAFAQPDYVLVGGAVDAFGVRSTVLPIAVAHTPRCTWCCHACGRFRGTAHRLDEQPAAASQATTKNSAIAELDYPPLPSRTAPVKTVRPSLRHTTRSNTDPGTRLATRTIELHLLQPARLDS
jgi:hypothetical protein